MSRVLLVGLTEAQVKEQCSAADVGISALETLASGGVRLVCMSSYGAAQMARKFKAHLIEGEVTRERHRPIKPLW